MNLVKSDSAVSPVIGTILLVAITVVLVAIIAAVVMGMAGSTANTKEVGLTVTQKQVIRSTSFDTESSLLLGVMIYGGKDVSDLRSLNVSVAGSSGTFYVWGPGYDDRYVAEYHTLSSPEEVIKFKASEIVGHTFYYAVATSDISSLYENALCTVTGTFADGTSAVLYQTYITYDHEPEETLDSWAGMSSDYIKDIAESGDLLFSPILT